MRICRILVFSWFIGGMHNLFGSAEQLYLDLIKKVLANTIYEDANVYGAFKPAIREKGRRPSISGSYYGRNEKAQ